MHQNNEKPSPKSISVSLGIRKHKRNWFYYLFIDPYDCLSVTKTTIYSKIIKSLKRHFYFNFQKKGI